MMVAHLGTSIQSFRKMCWRCNLSDWCSMMLGFTVFALNYTMGVVTWKMDASGIYVTLHFLLALAGLLYFLSKILKIMSQATEEDEALFHKDYTQTDKNPPSHRIKNTSAKYAVFSNTPESSLTSVKSTYCQTKIKPDKISSQLNVDNKYAYPHVTGSKLDTKKAEAIKCILTSPKSYNAKCLEHYVSGPVPGGRYIQRTRRENQENSGSLSPEGIYVPGNIAQRRYTRVQVSAPDGTSGSEMQNNTSDENRRLNESESSINSENKQNSSSEHETSATELSNENQNKVSFEMSERKLVDASDFLQLHRNRAFCEGIYIPGNFAQRRYIRTQISAAEGPSGSQTQNNTSDENHRLNLTESSIIDESSFETSNSSLEHDTQSTEKSNEKQNEEKGEMSERKLVDASDLLQLRRNRSLCEGIYIPGNTAQRRYIRTQISTPKRPSSSQTQSNTSNENLRLNLNESSIIDESSFETSNSSLEHETPEIEKSNENQNEEKEEMSERKLVDASDLLQLRRNRSLCEGIYIPGNIAQRRYIRTQTSTPEGPSGSQTQTRTSGQNHRLNITGSSIIDESSFETSNSSLEHETPAIEKSNENEEKRELSERERVDTSDLSQLHRKPSCCEGIYIPGNIAQRRYIRTQISASEGPIGSQAQDNVSDENLALNPTENSIIRESSFESSNSSLEHESIATEISNENENEVSSEMPENQLVDARNLPQLHRNRSCCEGIYIPGNIAQRRYTKSQISTPKGTSCSPKQDNTSDENHTLNPTQSSIIGESSFDSSNSSLEHETTTETSDENQNEVIGEMSERELGDTSDLPQSHRNRACCEGVYIPGNIAQRRYIRTHISTLEGSCGSQAQDNTSGEYHTLHPTESSIIGESSFESSNSSLEHETTATETSDENQNEVSGKMSERELVGASDLPQLHRNRSCCEGIYIPGNIAQRRYIRTQISAPVARSDSQTQDNISDENHTLNPTESSIIGENKQTSATEISKEIQNEVSGEISEREIVDESKLPQLHRNRSSRENNFSPAYSANDCKTPFKQTQSTDLPLTLGKPPSIPPRKSQMSSGCSFEPERSTALKQEASNRTSLRIQSSQGFNTSTLKRPLRPVPPPRRFIRDSEDPLSLVPVRQPSPSSERTHVSISPLQLSQQVPRSASVLMGKSHFPSVMPRRFPLGLPHTSTTRMPPQIPAQRTRFPIQSSGQNSPPPLPPRRKLGPQ